MSNIKIKRIVEKEFKLCEIDNTLDETQPIAGCKFITLKRNVCLLGMKPCVTLYFRGVLEIICIKGEIEIFGYQIKRGEKVDVYSLLGSSSYYIRSKRDSINKTSAAINILKKKFIDLFKYVGNDGVILLLKNKLLKYNNCLERFQQKNIHIFPNKAAGGIAVHKTAENVLNCTFDYTFGKRIYQKLITDKSWDIYAESLINNDDKRLVICGGAGFGKSTMLHYIVNKVVSRTKVVIIDFDIGQSEMNISSCISYFIVDKPLLGPNFIHMQQPERSICVGTVNPTDCVIEYICAVKELMKMCYEDESLIDLPWIINTMGFSRGIGVILTSAIVRAVQPTTLLILNSETESLKRFNFTQSLTNNKTASAILDLNQLSSNNFPCKTIQIKAPVDYVPQLDNLHQTKLSSKKKREASEIIYFSRPLMEITITISENENHQLLQCKPGDILALCYMKANLKMCKGFGKVCNVDSIAIEINITTPINVPEVFGEIPILLVKLDQTSSLEYQADIKQHAIFRRRIVYPDSTVANCYGLFSSVPKPF